MVAKGAKSDIMHIDVIFVYGFYIRGKSASIGLRSGSYGCRCHARKKLNLKRSDLSMYTKDKHNRITLRLNENQFEFVRSNADILGVSPSDFLRMVINASMFTQQKIDESKNISEEMSDIVSGAVNVMKDGEGRENDKTNINNIV